MPCAFMRWKRSRIQRLPPEFLRLLGRPTERGHRPGVRLPASVGLFALRCVMAFSVGGEYTGVMTYLLESSQARNRGLVNRWLLLPAKSVHCSPPAFRL